MLTRSLASPIAKLVVTACLLATVFATASGATAAPVDNTPIFPGWTAHASTVTCPAKAPRTLTSEQTATFLQSWLPDSLYKNLPEHKPPTGLPECTITVRYTASGTAQPNLRIRYVSDGHSAWISSDLGRWIIAPQSRRVILSFDGHGTYVPVVAPSAPVPSTIAKGKPAVKTKSNHSDSWLFALAIAILVGGSVLFAVRHRRGVRRVDLEQPTSRQFERNP